MASSLSLLSSSVNVLSAFWLFRLWTLYLSLRILFSFFITQFNLRDSSNYKQNWSLFSIPASTASGPVSCHHPLFGPPYWLPCFIPSFPRSLSTKCSFQNPDSSISIRNHQRRLSLWETVWQTQSHLRPEWKQTFSSEKNSMEMISRDES